MSSQRQRYDRAIEAARRESATGLGDAELADVWRKVRLDLDRPEPRRWPFVIGLALAGAAMAFAVLTIGPRLHRGPAGPPSAPMQIDLVARSGAVRIDGGLGPGPAPLAPGTKLELEPEARLAMRVRGQARIAVFGPARVRLDGGGLAFDQGVAVLSVEHRTAGAAPFRVRAGASVVTVRGTELAIDVRAGVLASLQVSEGLVELEEGGVTRRIAGGEFWAAPGVVPAPPPALADAYPAAETDLGDDLPTAPEPEAATAEGPRQKGARADPWTQASRLLKTRRCEELTKVLAPIHRNGVAEDQGRAMLLEAECALRTGRRPDARALYEEIGRRFPGTASGETALYEAGKLSVELGDRARGLSLFEEALRRYPHSRLTDATTFARCELLVQEHRRDDAIACLEGYRTNFPGGVHVAEAIRLEDSLARAKNEAGKRIH